MSEGETHPRASMRAISDYAMICTKMSALALHISEHLLKSFATMALAKMQQIFALLYSICALLPLLSNAFILPINTNSSSSCHLSANVSSNELTFEDELIVAQCKLLNFVDKDSHTLTYDAIRIDFHRNMPQNGEYRQYANISITCDPRPGFEETRIEKPSPLASWGDPWDSDDSGGSTDHFLLLPELWPTKLRYAFSLVRAKGYHNIWDTVIMHVPRHDPGPPAVDPSGEGIQELQPYYWFIDGSRRRAVDILVGAWSGNVYPRPNPRGS